MKVFEVETGGQLASVDEDRDSKFQEFRDVPRGAVIDGFHLSWLPASGGWSFRLDGTNALPLDVAAGGVTRRLHPQQRPPAGDRGRGARRDRGHPDAGWDLEVTAAREKREGLIRIGTGTYTRSNTPGSFDRERFTIRGLEMPEPVHTRATDVGLATSYRRGRGFFTAGWQGSRFSNEIDTLNWDNPFEAAPSVASTSDRGRAAQNAIDLWPDNTWERLFASGGFVGGYTRSVWTAGGACRFGRGVTLDLEYASTTWDYDVRQVDKTREDAYAVKLRIEPADWVAARLSWIDASREFDGDYEVGFETSQERTRYGVDVDFLPGDRWSFGVTFGRWEDEHPGSVAAVTSLPYGLVRSKSDTIAGFLAYAAKPIAVTFTLGRDTSTFESLTVAKTMLASDAVTCAASKRWTRTEDDTVDWGSVAIEATLIPDRLRLVADVTYTVNDGRPRTHNPDTPDVNSAVAYPFPAFKPELASGRLTLAWTLNRELDFLASYCGAPGPLLIRAAIRRTR